MTLSLVRKICKQHPTSCANKRHHGLRIPLENTLFKVVVQVGAIVLIPSSQQVTTLGLGSNSWVERYFEDGGLIVCDTRWLSYPVIKAESTSVCGLSLRIISSTFWINCVEHRMCSVKVLPLNWHYSKRPMHQDISIDKYIIVTDLNHLKGIEISKMLIRLPINKRLILQIF